jgi:NADH-quinone oxidoreductase subunit N
MTAPAGPIYDYSLTALLPELWLTGAALLVLLLSLTRTGVRRIACPLVSAGSLLVALGLVVGPQLGPDVSYAGMFHIDRFAIFFKALFLVVGLLTVLVSAHFIRFRAAGKSELYFLILSAIIGMMFVASSGNFLLLFLGLEITSISTYVMIGILKDNAVCGEAAMKYILLSIFSSALFLYGVAFIYGLSGSLDFAAVAAKMRAASPAGRPILYLAFVLMLSGLGFKMAVAPFHMYVPDVYQGAPTAVTAFLSVGPKAAAFAALLRVFLTAVMPLTEVWTQIIALLAVVSMVWGNTVALAQRNVKRMLAYSSIAHAGYALIGLAAVQATGEVGLSGAVGSVLFYLFAYALMNLGAFSVLMATMRGGEFGETLEDIAGLAQRRPLAAFTMLIFLLALAGIPPTIGFLAKFYVLAAAIQAKFYVPAAIGVINTVIGVYYYVRVIVYMYARAPEAEVAESPSLSLHAALVAAGAAVVVLGVFPHLILNSAMSAAKALF